MATYYVDPTNGSNDNDGLTPDTAYADIFTGVGGADDIPTFWIKRGETIPITESKTFNFGNVYAWPKSDAPDYADRPQAGIDANWDNDLLADPVIATSDTDITNFNVTDVDLASLHFVGVTISLDGGSAGVLFNLKSARIILDRCLLSGDSHGMYLFRYLAGSSSKDIDNGVVELNDCVVENKDWDRTRSILYYLNSNDDCNYKKEFHINRTRVLGIGTTIYALRSGNGRYVRVFIEDSEIKNSLFFARVANEEGTYAQYIYFTINNSSIQSEDDNFETAYSSSHCSRTFHLIANNSTFVSGQFTIDDYHSSSNPSYYSRMSNITLRGCNFKAKNFYRNYAYCKNYMDNIDIRGCTFKDMSYVFNFYGLKQVTKFNFVDNILDEVERLIHCNDAYAAKCKFNVSLKGQSISSYLIDRSGGGEIYLEDCNIGKELAGASTENMNIVAVNSNFDAIKGKGHSVSLSSCRLESSDGSALEGITGEIFDSQIISSYEKILTEDANVSFDGCNLEVKGINPPAGGRSVKLTKTVINGNPEPMMILNDRATKKVSPIYRVNGNGYSYFIQAMPKDFVSRTVSSSTYAKHQNAKPNLTLYMTSVDNITDTDRMTVKASFVSEGILKVIDMPVVVDTASQWDGVQVENEKYKAQVDLSSFSIVDGSKIKMVISMSHESGKTSSVNIDTILGQE